jgi:hypothetical protein
MVLGCILAYVTIASQNDEARPGAQEGSFRWLIFLLAAFVGLAHFGLKREG